MGLSLWKYISFHFPRMGNGCSCSRAKGYWKTHENVSMSANFLSLFFPMLLIGHKECCLLAQELEVALIAVGKYYVDDIEFP